MILITDGMNMPSSCKNCIFNKWVDITLIDKHLHHREYCTLTEKDTLIDEKPTNKRAEFCPLIEVFDTGECKH